MYSILIFIYLTMKNKKKLHNKVTFKTYNQNQLLLIPPSWDSFIEENHPVRIVNRIVDQLDLNPLIATYEGGGSSSYHPKMLLKILVYGYLRNIYSSRKIETALKENIHFMWLSGMQFPDHNTINDFRSKRLEGQFKSIFTQVVLLLVEEGLVDIKDIYTDGTKIEANANRYTFVWAKAIARNKERIRKQLEELWAYVEQVYETEKEAAPDKPNFTDVSSEQVEATVKSINEALAEKDIDAKKKAKLRYAIKNWPDKLRAYAAQEEILNGRNSYSKTDTDASFMRNKEDYMKNGQLTPCYNIQFSTSDKFVVNYTIGQTTSDTVLYQTHMENYYEQYGFYPDCDTADAGYGSEENYEYLESKDIEAFVKYSYFHKEHNDKKKKKNPPHLNPSKKENLYYNTEKDCYYCPMGQPMLKIREQRRKTKTGYLQTSSVYQAKNCINCPMRGACHKSIENRIITVNHNLERHKAKVRELLTSELGVEKRGQRCVDVEGTFGQLKHNKGYRRFLLRGKEKVEIELGLLALGMNIARMGSKLAARVDEVCPIGSILEHNEAKKANKRAKKAS